MLLLDLRLITTKEAAEKLKVTPITIRRKIQQQTMNAMQLPSRLGTHSEKRIDTREIERILHNNPKPMLVQDNIVYSTEALTAKDLSKILSINEEIAGRYLREYMGASGYSNLRISQEALLTFLVNLQTIRTPG